MISEYLGIMEKVFPLYPHRTFSVVQPDDQLSTHAAEAEVCMIQNREHGSSHDNHASLDPSFAIIVHVTGYWDLG